MLTIVDMFSKMAHFVALHKLQSAEETAQPVAQHAFQLHGLPESVVSDRGPQFALVFWKEFCGTWEPLHAYPRGSICRPTGRQKG